MKTPSTLVSLAAASFAALAIAAVDVSSAQAQSMRTVQGQSYWRGDPGPVAPDSYWSGGQYKYDANHYLSYYGSDPQGYSEVVYADHAGTARCVWRKRVLNSNWEYHHPYVKVCRD